VGTEEQPQEEVSSYSEAILENPRLSWESGDLKKAESEYRLALIEYPEYLEAWTELCILLLQQRRETDAERAGKHVLKLRDEKNLTWAKLRSELRTKHVDIRR
jgi:Flp pilus assembly protein TadD